MRGIGLLLAGILVGVTIRGTIAQERGIVALNHVAIAVNDFESSAKFYTQVMGFREAFSFRDAGGPVLSYFQVSRNTFIELMPVTPQRPAGFVHFGLEVAALDSEVRRLSAAGIKLDGPMVSARTKARGANMTTPHGIRIELFEYGPDSLQRKAMNSWTR